MIAPAAVGCKRLLANGKLDAAIKMNRCGEFYVQHAARLIAARL